MWMWLIQHMGDWQKLLIKAVVLLLAEAGAQRSVSLTSQHLNTALLVVLGVCADLPLARFLLSFW